MIGRYLGSALTGMSLFSRSWQVFLRPLVPGRRQEIGQFEE
jgi:hypothetical protein